MKVGIIGPPGSGKTTLFNAVTGANPQAAAKKSRVAVVKAPDPRLTVLYDMTDGRKLVPTEVAFSDVGGRLGQSSREHGIDPQLLNLMRAEDAFAIVVADFAEYVRGIDSPADPLADARDLENDLMLADLVVIEGKLERMVKENAKGLERNTLEKCQAQLEKEMPLRVMEFSRDELKAISGYRFLSLKQGILIRNMGEEKVGGPDPEGIRKFTESRGLKYMSIAVKLQMEISQMDPAEKEEFVKAMGLEGLALDRLIMAAYETLDLISFFTVGGPNHEVHAWTVRRGATAVEAAGRIHSDLERGFIRAEIIGYDDFTANGGETGAKKAGKMRVEGKDYIMNDGDIVYIRFNV